MAASYQDCLRLVKEAHPDLYPVWYIEKDGQYLFNMLKRGVNQDEAPCNFYAVDTKSGKISGSLPVMSVMGNQQLRDKLDNPNMIDAEDQKADIKHRVLENGVGWGIRLTDSDSLTHHGIIGQKWGFRRFQYKNGKLTPEGKERYAVNSGESKRKTDSENETSKGTSKTTQNNKKGTVTGLSGSVTYQSKQQQKDLQKSIINRNRDENKRFANEVKSLYERKKAERKMGLFEKMRTKDAAYAEIWAKENEKVTSKDLVDREQTKKGGLDSGKIATDVALTIINPLNVAYLGADAARAAASRRKEKKYLENREKNSELDPETGFYKKKEGEYDEKQDLAAVNPLVYDFNTNSKSNCMLCTTTYDMRQRGYDVTAQMDSVGYSFGDLKRWYPDAKMERNLRFDSNGVAIKQKDYIKNTLNSLLEQGNGARGNIMVCFKGGGAHSVVYEVKNGKVMFKDGQINKVYGGKNTLTQISESPEQFLVQTIGNIYTRLDNIEPDLKRIKSECCR